MKTKMFSVAAGLTCAALIAVSSAFGGAQTAKVVKCGSVRNNLGVGGPGLVQGEKFYWRVTVIKGNVTCAKARVVIGDVASGKRAAGWKCSETSPVRCTHGGREVDGKFYGVKPKT
jgi:hypothetical protein